ncbi:unnamed protein product [Lactuca saligna]|uniref:HP domain-containing protein n=1 Tax=Lactuca saligna TaxID=75948 RepID=A0AA35ZZQ6_LACSI|nr:unnamed protein product [Lactuca saligna]
MSIRVLEPAFQGVGQKVGIEIWKIENSQPVLLPNSDHGRFSSGDSYIVLKTAGKAGAYTYNIHFWLGKDANQDEAGAAAVKAVELDSVLGNRAVEYRELQGHESNRFLSYFKPCLIPPEGGFGSEVKTPEEEEEKEKEEEEEEEEEEEDGEEKEEKEKPEPRLYTCKGKRVVRLKQVPFTRSTLNHDEIFILDTKDKVFMFNGANTNVQERFKALDVVQNMKERFHEGNCNVAIVDEGKLQSEGPSAEFWAHFGGFAPIGGKKVSSDDDIIPEKTPPKLYCIVRGQFQEIEGELSKSSLHNDRCYLLYCGTDLFIWVGRTTPLPDKKSVMHAAEEFILKENLPKSTPVTRIGQGHETSSFKSNFASWSAASAASVPEETRGKVAALLKQQGAFVKGQTKTAPVEEEVPPLLGENGKTEVWRIDGEEKTELPKEDIGKFYSGDCYICLYSYHSDEKKEDHYLCCWIGKDSIQEDQKTAVQQTTSMFNSMKCKPVQGRMHQGKEAPQFVAIFQPMVVLKGGLSSGYKNYIAEKGLHDETYSPDTAALIEISGTSVHNNKAQQVERVATSLNSYSCFILQSSTTVSTWYGNQSTPEQQQLAAKVVELLKSGVPVKFSREGKESLAFWLALGGKQSYSSSKVTQEIIREPHLFEVISNKGKLEIEEIHSFEQDDLFPEDVLILDTHAEVIVWVGHLAQSTEKQNAFETGEKYVELAASMDSLSPSVILYRVTEGNEPCFFTTYFSWDPAKTTAHGNAFHKKAVQLFGSGCVAESQEVKPPGNKLSGATQRASAMAALTSAFSKSTTAPKTPQHGPPPRMLARGSQRAAAIAALSNVLTAEKKGPPSDHHSPPHRHKKFSSLESASAPVSSSTSPVNFDQAPFRSGNVTPVRSENVTPVKGEEASDVFGSNEVADETSEPNAETNEEEPSNKETTDENENGGEDTQSTYSYERLIAKSTNPVIGIDYKKREMYLSPEEFEEIFKMSKEAFYQLPRWKQDQFFSGLPDEFILLICLLCFSV